MTLTRAELESLPDGMPIGSGWAYKCDYCKRTYIENVHPDQQDFRRCRACMTGSQPAVYSVPTWSLDRRDFEVEEE